MNSTGKTAYSCTRHTLIVEAWTETEKAVYSESMQLNSNFRCMSGKSLHQTSVTSVPSTFLPIISDNCHLLKVFRLTELPAILLAVLVQVATARCLSQPLISFMHFALNEILGGLPCNAMWHLVSHLLLTVNHLIFVAVKFHDFSVLDFSLQEIFVAQPYSANTRPTVLVSNNIFAAEWIRKFDATHKSRENFMLEEERWFTVLESWRVWFPHRTLGAHYRSPLARQQMTYGTISSFRHPKKDLLGTCTYQMEERDFLHPWIYIQVCYGACAQSHTSK